MAGLLDSLFSGNSVGGGLLDYLNSPLYQNAPPSQFQQPDMSMTPTERQMMAMVRPDVLPSFPNAMPPGGMPQQAPQQPGPPQASPIAIGSYMMPRMGPASAYQSDPAAIPPNAQPTQGQAPQGQMPQMPDQAMPLPPALGGMGSNAIDRIARGLQSVGNGGGLIGALTGNYTDPQSVGQQNLAAQFHTTRQALINNGLSEKQAHQVALLSVLNPEAAKTVLPELLTNKVDYKTEKDALGAEHGYWIDKINQTKTSADGGGTGGSSAVGPQVLASGVKQYDPNLTGPDYLKQFGPEVQSYVQKWLRGDEIVTNPRLQGMSSFAKTVATKYAADMGIPFSDNLYAEKRKLRTDLAASGNSSLGGILSNGESSFAHLAAAGESMADLGNTSHNFPLGGYIAHGQNYLGNTLGGSSTVAKVKSLNNNLGRYGQESTKFYAGSGGGVEERTAARKEMNAETTSSEEYASYLEKEKSLMLERLNEKFHQIRTTLGEDEATREIAKQTPDIEKNIKKIDASVKKLRGEAPEAPAASKSEAPKSGAYVWTPDKGLQPK